MTAEKSRIVPGLRHRGRVIPLGDGDHLIGRGAGCAIRIPSVTVSRRHVNLRVRGGRVWVIDLGSRNGTWLNRERLRPNEAREMSFGDHIYLPAEDLCLVPAGEALEDGQDRLDAGDTGPNPAAVTLQPGGARRRFLAAMIDMALFTAMSAVLAVPLVLDFPHLPASGSLLDSLAAVTGDHAWMHLLFITLGVWVVLWLLYFTIGWGMLGATPGQAIMGLRLVDHRQRYPIGMARALLRLVAYSVGSLPFMAGHLLVIGRSDKRALHDMLAGTRVVRKPRRTAPPGPGGDSPEGGGSGEARERVLEAETTGDLPTVGPFDAGENDSAGENV